MIAYLGSSAFKVALVYGQMNEPPGARARVALTGLTVAEYFRDQEGQDVLLFIDNIFRFTQAGSEVCTIAVLRLSPVYCTVKWECGIKMLVGYRL